MDRTGKRKKERWREGFYPKLLIKKCLALTLGWTMS
jgi:hypothetical protein